MTVQTPNRRSAVASSSGDAVARAWIGMALIPVFFVVGFAVGEVLYAALGYKPENDDAPLWVDLVASLTALAVTLVPCVGAVIHGRRATRAGRQIAWVPVAVSVLAGAGLVVLTALNI